MSSYGKLNLLPIKSIYMVVSSRERQRRLIQAKVYYKLFYSLSEKKRLTEGELFASH